MATDRSCWALSALRTRVRPGALAALAALVLAAPLCPGGAFAAPGSGTAVIAPAAAVPAGTASSWTITYRAAESFHPAAGGVVEVEIPPGWTPPTLTPGAPGEVTVVSPHLSSATIVAPRTVRLLIGAGAAPKVSAGDSVRVVYGGAGAAAASAPTAAPATAVFAVRSDPDANGGASPVALASGSPSLAVVPGPPAVIRLEDGAGAPVGSFTRTTDEDTTSLHLFAYDAYGNALGSVSGTWSVIGGIGAVAPAAGPSTTLTLTTVGSGRVAATAGSLSDSTGTITVTHGAYASLAASPAPSGTAGAALSLSAAARDADGNTVTSGPGSGALLRVVAFADSAGTTPADPSLLTDTVTLVSGSYVGAVTPRRAGDYWLGVRDEGAGSASARTLVTVAADAPHHLALSPATLALVAGVPATVTVEVRDAFENPSPLAAAEALALWSNRPAGVFLDAGGAPIFDVTIPAGGTAAAFRFRDTQATTSPGTVRAIDTGFTAPFLGVGESAVTTAPAAPAGTVALAAAPDSLEADGVSPAAVASGVVRDAFGNAVAAGVSFTVTGTLVAPQGDADGGTAGVQWLTDATGVLSGAVVAGTARGAGSVAVASTTGSASGAASLTLLAGPPSGAVALAASPDTLPADGTGTTALSASGLTDANGNPVEDGELFTVSTDLGTITTPDADAGASGVQIATSGAALAFTLRAPSSLGVATIAASSVRGNASGSAAVVFGAGAVDGIQSSIAATSPAPVGATGSLVTVTLRDAQGHPLAGIPAGSIALAGSGVSVATAPLGAATDAGGAIDFRATATEAGSAVISAAALGTPLAATASIDFEPGPIDHYTAAGPPGPLTAGGADTLRVTARDAFGNPAPAAAGSRMSVRVVGGVATAPDTVTFTSETVAIPFTPLAASSLTLLVREVVSPLRSVTYGPVAVSPSAAYAVDSVHVAPATVAAGDSALLSVWVADAYGNLRPGAAVAASILSGSGGVSPASATTDGSGRATFRILGGPLPGPVTVRAVVSASPAPDSVRADTVAVQVVPGTATSVQIAHSTGGIVAGGLLSVNLTLRDAFGNVATAATPTLWLRTTTATPSADNVRWSAGVGAAGVLADSAGSDGALYAFSAADSGTATVAVRDTLAETIRLRASGSGLPLAETAPISIPAAPASQMALVSGDGQSGVVADTLAAPLRVRVRDAFGNPAAGAMVRFSVTAGGGSVDAIAEGGADSDAAADAAGLATCDIWRLGVVSGTGNNAARAALVATPSVFVAFTASALPDTAASLSLAPGALALIPTQTAAVTATARDAYGNVVPGVPLTLYLAGPVHGSLQPVAGATTGGPGSQSGVTGAAGTLSVRYAAPSTAPAVDSIYARGASVGPVGMRVVVSAGATDSLRVTADSLTWTAGVPVRVRVTPIDAQGNVVTGDGADAAMRAVAGVSFAPPSGPLASGSFETFATATVAGTIPSIGADHTVTPAVGGATGPVTVRPASPAGTIPVAAGRTTLTADGRSVATVTFGPVRDAFGNAVAAGTALTASATSGSLAATSLATDAAGFAATALIAPSASGSGAVDVVSSPAGASGTLAFTFLDPPSLAASAASVAPPVVAPGNTVAFRADVTNTGSAAITLGGATRLAFGPAGSVVTASLATAPVAVAASQTVTLSFAPVSIPAGLAPGSYAPTLRAVGTDATGEAFDFYPSLAGAAVHVAGIRVLAAGASPDPAPLGYADLRLTFTVENLAATDAVIESGSPSFSAGTFTVNGMTPLLPAPLPALATATVVVSVRVPASGIPDGTTVGATLAAGVRFGALTVSGANGAPLPFRVVSGASLTPVVGGTAPARLLRGRTFAPVARVRNDGTADVTLLRGPTSLVLGHAGGDTLRATLRANQVVAGGDEADLAFDSLAVPAAAAKGFYGVTLLFRGTESGQSFAADVSGAPPVIEVLDPSILAVTALAPDTVSAGQNRPVGVTVSNAGDVPFAAGAATTLRLGPPILRTLALSVPATIPAGGSAVLDFTAAPLGDPAGAGIPGGAAATLEARGTEEGRVREESLAAGTLRAMAPAALDYVAGSTVPDTVRAGVTVPVSAIVRNGGGSPVTVDPAATLLTVSDGVESASGYAAGPPFVLVPAAQALLSFPSVDFPAALASQPYPVSIRVEGVEWGMAASVPVVSPGGEIRVLEPAPAVQVSSLDVGAPVQAAAGAGSIRLWGLRVAPLVPPGGAAATRLESVALTVLVDGVASTSPGAAVAAIEARDAGGAILAQAVPPASGPVPLVFAAPIDLSASSVFDLYFDVSLQPGLDAADVGLRLAAETDLVARDGLTGVTVPITGPGGVAFMAIESRRVTLFAKAHGYPNPFRAGSESVLLSYVLPADAPVRVRIVTLFGELVRELSYPAASPGGARGLNEVPWDGRNGAGRTVVPGVYVARIEGGGLSEAVKVGVRR